MGKSKARTPKKEGPLTKIFEKKKASPKKGSSSPSSSASQKTPSRGQTSNFITYLRSAMRSKTPSIVDQASHLHEHYQRCSVEDKRALILEFFKQGGKRTGLATVFGQHISSTQLSNDLEWRGYCLPDKVMELYGVTSLAFCVVCMVWGLSYLHIPPNVSLKSVCCRVLDEGRDLSIIVGLVLAHAPQVTEKTFQDESE